MEFDEATLKAAGFSKKKIAMLVKRRRGGTSGTIGYIFQRRFALIRVVESSAEGATGTTIRMEVLCPVDDVVVTGAEGRHEHAQCKTSASDTWNKEGKKLTREFRDQRRLLMTHDVTEAQIRLVLVVADAAQAARLRVAMPTILRLCTRVDYVPHPEPNHCAWTIPRLRDALDQLLPSTLRTTTWREVLFKNLDHAAGQPWRGLTVSEILNAVAENERLPIALPGAMARAWSVPHELWGQALEILESINHLSIDVSGNVCYYRRDNESGMVARCDTPGFKRFAEDVVAFKPASMDELYKVLPR